MFILKGVMDKAHTSISVTKIDLNDVTKQKPSCLVGLRFEVCRRETISTWWIIWKEKVLLKEKEVLYISYRFNFILATIILFYFTVIYCYFMLHWFQLSFDLSDNDTVRLLKCFLKQLNFKLLLYIFFCLSIYNYANVVILYVAGVSDSGKSFEYYYYLRKLCKNPLMYQKLLITFILSAVITILLKTYSIGIQ